MCVCVCVCVGVCVCVCDYVCVCVACEGGETGQLGEAARDLGLADTGRADHEDVLGHDLVLERA